MARTSKRSPTSILIKQRPSQLWTLALWTSQPRHYEQQRCSWKGGRKLLGRQACALKLVIDELARNKALASLHMLLQHAIERIKELH